MVWMINWDNPPPRCGKYDTDECREDCPDFRTKLCLWHSEFELEGEDMNLLKPIESVECSKHRRLIAVDGCELCEHMEEIRRPWYRFVVKCNFEVCNKGDRK